MQQTAIERIIEAVFVGAALFISVLLLGIRFRDTILPKKSEPVKSITQELIAIRDAYNELRLKELQREIDELKEDVTDHDHEIKKIRDTRPIPPSDEIENYSSED